MGKQASGGSSESEGQTKKVIANTHLSFVKNLTPYSMAARSNSPSHNRGAPTI